MGDWQWNLEGLSFSTSRLMDSAPCTRQRPASNFPVILIRSVLQTLHLSAPDHISEAGEPHGYWPGAPDLAVEVVSPEDVYTELEEKVLEWLEAGTRMVVVVNPRKRAVTVYRSLSDVVVLTNHDILDGGDVVPGWKLPLGNLFA